MEKKDCTACGRPYGVKCHPGCNINDDLDCLQIVAPYVGIDLAIKPNFEGQNVDLTGLPNTSDASILAAKALKIRSQKDEPPKDIIDVATSGPTRGICPPITIPYAYVSDRSDSVSNDIVEQVKIPLSDPDAVLDEFHPRLLSVALTGNDAEGSAEEFKEAMHKLDEPYNQKRDVLDRKKSVICEQLAAGRAVVNAIYGVPDDDASDFTVSTPIPENKIKSLHKFMSVEAPFDEFPPEIRFSVSSKSKLLFDESEQLHRYIHLEAMPPELQAVVKNYLSLAVGSCTFHDHNMQRFKESAIELAASIEVIDKKLA